MARPSYSQEQKQEMCGLFIETTIQIIKEEGIENVTIRNVAKKASYNSATLYHYFQNLDHLLCFVALNFFREYYENLIYYISDVEDPYIRFIWIWDFFCDCTLKHPLIFYKFFFTSSQDTKKIISQYYSIFPQQFIKNHDNILQSMLLGGKLPNRNAIILKPLCDLGYLEDTDLPIVNNLIVLSYKDALTQKILNGEDVDSNDLIKDLNKIIKHLLKKRK